MIDTHAHITKEYYAIGEDEGIIERSLKSNVTRIINVGTSVKSSSSGMKLSNQNPGVVYYSVGIHPHEIGGLLNVIKLESLLKDALAIGECGLDYYWTEYNHEENKEIQKELFSKQLDMALKYKLPVILHCRERKAAEDLIEIIKSNNITKGVWHSVTATTTEVSKMLDQGFYFSFNGIITFKNADEIRSLLQYVPLDRVILETDSPFLAPEPLRGHVNEPGNILYVYQKVCEIKMITMTDLEKIINENVKNLFGI